MKKLLVSVLLSLFISIQSYPQNLNSRPMQLKRTDNPFGLPEQLIKNGLNKSNASLDIQGTIYKPAVVINDSIYKITYSYDTRGSLVKTLYERLYEGKWDTTSKASSIYDANGNLLSFVLEYGRNGVVTNSYKSNYYYGPDGKLLNIIASSYLNGSLMQSGRTSYTYDASGNIASALYEVGSFNGWASSGRSTYTYDSKGNILTALNENWQANSWINGSRTTNTYDTDNNLLTSLSEIWMDSAWQNLSRAAYTYLSPRHMLSALYEEWENDAWKNSSRAKGTYDGNGNMTSELEEEWTNNAWVNYSKANYTYDTHNNAIKGESFQWSSDGKWIPYKGGLAMSYNNGIDVLDISGSVAEVQYQAITGIESTPVAINDYSLAQNYPNPFNPSTTINYFLKKAGNVKLTVFDALGKIVSVVVDEYKPAGNYSVKFDASSLPSGMYIYRLEAGEYTASRKFILMK